MQTYWNKTTSPNSTLDREPGNGKQYSKWVNVDDSKLTSTQQIDSAKLVTATSGIETPGFKSLDTKNAQTKPKSRADNMIKSFQQGISQKLVSRMSQQNTANTTVEKQQKSSIFPTNLKRRVQGALMSQRSVA